MAFTSPLHLDCWECGHTIEPGQPAVTFDGDTYHENCEEPEC